MKLSIKSIALAVALAASASGASAAIDTGANGELFFNIWDASGSYSRDLNVTIDSFSSLLNASGNLNLSFAADSTFTSFLAGADSATLKWNVQAVDTAGARRILETYTTLPSAAKSNDLMRTTAGNLQVFATAINGKLVAGADSVAVDAASAAYAGKTIYGSTLNNNLGFSNSGTLANNSFASGLNFMTINALATGTAKSTYTQFFDGANNVSVYLDSANALHISAAPVPEPESYAMLLAGLGMLGFMARRRLNSRG